MTAETALELRAWHLPEPMSWWPPAPGWWLVTGVLLVMIWLLWRGWQQRQRRASSRQALRELAALHAQFQVDSDGRCFAVEVSQLLRRVALTRWPAPQVAGLTGREWLEFLDANGGEFMDSTAGQVLRHAAYRAEVVSAADAERLHQAARDWIRRERNSDAQF